MTGKIRKSIILLLTLVISFLSFGPFTNVTAEESEPEFIGSIEYANPHYFPGSEPVFITAAGKTIGKAEHTDATSIPASTVSYIRAEFLKRTNPIVITVPNTSDAMDVAADIWDVATETHTGKPKEGDSIAWSYGGYSASCTRYPGASTVQVSFNVYYYTTAAQEAAVDKAVTALKSELNLDNKSNYLIVQGVYEWIADHVEYSFDFGNDLVYTVYGALNNREAVCQGYSLLFYRMMLEYGIDCRFISSEDHAWNIVKLKGKYYNIDSTWASTTGVHEWYFLKGQDNFPDHPREDQYTTSDFNKKYPMDPEDYVPTEADLDTRDYFRDVKDENAYYFTPVYWAVDNGITVGYGGNNKFSPNVTCTREQIVTFLWRLMDEPEPDPEKEISSFTDVKESDWYYKPIAWASQNGITTGLNDGTGRFGVGLPCTREQCVTFLYRAAGSPEVEEYIHFTDVEEDRYFYNAISWAASKGITVGLNDGTGRFGVGQKCSRAMIVTFLYRYANQ